jgi:hypothetical protein
MLCIQGQNEWLNAIYEVTKTGKFHAFSCECGHKRDKLNEWVEAEMKTITQEVEHDSLYCEDHSMPWYRVVTFQSLATC